MTITTHTHAAFTDQDGIQHHLDSSHRDKVKPNWRMLFLPRQERDDDTVKHDLTQLADRVKLAVSLLNSCGCHIRGKNALIFGCASGEEAYYLAGCGAASVAACDNLQHNDNTKTKHPGSDLSSPDSQMGRLVTQHLEQLQQIDKLQTCRISFMHDDITESTLTDSAFDVICSWRVLEHLERPWPAFAEMYRLLRPGGLAYHEYNPFFAIDGGHSAVTLDMPWGHVRLCPTDVERYLDTLRPHEKTIAFDFYQRQLNRMSLSDLASLATSSGFEILALLPRTRTEDILELTPEIMQQVYRTYPQLTISDLVSRVVRVVLRKPE